MPLRCKGRRPHSSLLFPFRLQSAGKQIGWYLSSMNFMTYVQITTQYFVILWFKPCIWYNFLPFFSAQTMWFCMWDFTPLRSRHFLLLRYKSSIKNIYICFKYWIINETNVQCQNYADITLFGVMNAVSWDSQYI